MANKILLTYIAAAFLFGAMGAIEMGFSVVVQNTMNGTPASGEEAVRFLIYQQFPLTAGIANAAVVFFTLALCIPAMIVPARVWLKVSGIMTAFSATFTMIVGLYVWVLTLKTKVNLGVEYNTASSVVQDLIQTSFECCGYFNSTSPPFVTDTTCPSPAAAALVQGCAAPTSSYANNLVDDIFTGIFGMVGIAVVLILATACLYKERKEQERFRHIDEKAGFRSF